MGSPGPRVGARRAWPEQRAAVSAASARLLSGGRALVAMPCGSGKTLVGIWVAEQLDVIDVVVLVPTLALLSQTLRTWRATSRVPRRVLAVCGDETAAQDADSSIPDVDALRAITAVTTSGNEVASFLAEGSRRLIVATYHSAGVVGAGLGHAGRRADLLIGDEAHRAVGEAGRRFTIATDDARLPAARRLFLTATPRVTSDALRRSAATERIVVSSMDDEDAFGPLVYELSFGAAVRNGRLADYQVGVMVADDRRHRVLAGLRRRLLLGEGERVDSELLATAALVLDAIARHRLRRVVTFHNLLEDAETFARVLPKLARLRGDPVPETHWVAGHHPEEQRDAALSALHDGAGERAVVLSNVQCLAEGVDVPAMDAIAFCAPRRSLVGIVQAVGRVMRTAPGKGRGLVLLPVVLDGELSADVEEIDRPEFRAVWDVVRALRDHDERLAAELDTLAVAGDGYTGDIIQLNGLAGLPAGFANAFYAAIVQRSTSTWLAMFARVAAFARDHQRPPFGFERDADGVAIGYWCGMQRRARATGVLAHERVEMLGSLPGWQWSRPAADDIWQQHFAALAAHIAEHGAIPRHSHVTLDGFRLGDWCNRQRAERANGTIKPEREHALDSLPAWWWVHQRPEWDAHLAAVSTHACTYGRPPSQSHVDPSGLAIGLWCLQRRRQHSNGRLTTDQIAALEAIPGWQWTSKRTAWPTVFDAALAYARQHQAPPPREHVTDTGLRIGAWCATQRQRVDDLPADRRAQLETIPGWWWTRGRTQRPWEDMHARVAAYIATHGTLPPDRFSDSDGARIGAWCTTQRTKHRNRQLTSDRVAALETLPGWAWTRDTARLPRD